MKNGWKRAYLQGKRSSGSIFNIFFNKSMNKACCGDIKSSNFFIFLTLSTAESLVET